MNIKVLLVESDAADAVFVQDVLTEMSDGDFWVGWATFETIHAANWEETVSVLSNDTIDIVLIAPNPSDAAPLVRFRALTALAPGIPIVLLTASDDREVAVRLLREGAQDVLVKSHLDCGPLARAMRHALERQRFVAAVRAASMMDPLTGLVNREAFLMLARRDRSQAERLGQRLLLLAVEPEALCPEGYIGERSDLAAIEASDFLRSLIGPGDLLGRISRIRFGLSIFDTHVEGVELAWSRISLAARERGIGVGGAIFDCRHPVSVDRLLEEAELDLIRFRAGMRPLVFASASSATVN